MEPVYKQIHQPGDIVGQNVNDEKARAFQKIVTAGWGNLSDGNVNESPVGHVSLIHIEAAELEELALAVFDNVIEDTDRPTIYPGSYVLVEDSDGNATLTEHLTLNIALNYYNHLQALNGGQQVDRTDLPLEVPVTKKARCSGCHLMRPLDAEGFFKPHGCVSPYTLNPGDRPEAISEIDEADLAEKLYLVCRGCGEACDEIKTAQEHGSVDPNTKVWCGEDGFDILPESEAL